MSAYLYIKKLLNSYTFGGFMNKIKSILLTITFLFLLSSPVAAYDSNNEYELPKSFKLQSNKVDMYLGQTIPFDMSFEGFPDYCYGDFEDDMSYSMSKNNVIRIYDDFEYFTTIGSDDDFYFDDDNDHDMYFVAKKAGTTVITFTLNGHVEKVTVRVLNKYSIDSSLHNLLKGMQNFSLKTMKPFIDNWSDKNQSNYQKIISYPNIKSHCKNAAKEMEYQVKKIKKINNNTYRVTIKFRYENSNGFYKRFSTLVNWYSLLGLFDGSPSAIDTLLGEARRSYSATYSSKTIKLTFRRSGKYWKLTEFPSDLETVFYSDMLSRFA